jgi:hypothetical protein
MDGDRAGGAAKRFNGVKVFSATMFQQREQLGETVTAWIAERKTIEIADMVITQSSDSSFHCVEIPVFFWEDVPVRPPGRRLVGV